MKKLFSFVLGELKTPQRHFEINWPLTPHFKTNWALSSAKFHQTAIILPCSFVVPRKKKTFSEKGISFESKQEYKQTNSIFFYINGHLVINKHFTVFIKADFRHLIKLWPIIQTLWQSINIFFSLYSFDLLDFVHYSLWG